MERMNSIFLGLMSVTPGYHRTRVITEVLQNAVKEKDFSIRRIPSSRGSCFIGGNIAENSGGPGAVKYRVVKDCALNLPKWCCRTAISSGLEANVLKTLPVITLHNWLWAAKVPWVS